MRSRALIALCLWVVTSAVARAAADVVTEPTPDPALVAVDACQKKIKRAGARFVLKTLSGLDACTREVLDCMQRAPGDQLCITEAGTTCGTLLVKLDTQKRRLVKSIRTTCSEDLVSLDEILSGSGIGYDEVAAECESALGQPVQDVRAIARCVAQQHQCQAEELFEVERPRARALMSVAGVHLDPLSCLTDHAGALGVVTRGGVGKALARCTKRIAKAGGKLVSKRREALDRCVDRVFGCVKVRPSEPGCLEAARIGCDKDFTKIAAADNKLGKAILQRCPPSALPFALLAGAEAANLAALAPTCASFGVSSLTSLEHYRVCLLRQHTCVVEELLRVAAPRSEELLGQVGRSLTSTFCPAPSPTATATPRPGETATPSPTRTPRPTRTPTPTPTATVVPVCGDNVVEGNEECDGTDLDDNECDDLCDQDTEGGTLSCRADCTFDFSGCPPPRDCDPF